MAKQVNLRLFHYGSGKHGGWWIEDVDRFEKWPISREEVDELVPRRFSNWVQGQERPQSYGSWAA